MRSSYCPLQLSDVVLQTCPNGIPHENLGKNAKMCCNMNTGSFQNLLFIWYRSHSRAYSHQTPPS